MTVALSMLMEQSVKKTKNWKYCIKCGHLNNGEETLLKRICLCASPLLVNPKLIGENTIVELYSIYYPNKEKRSRKQE